MNSNVNQQPSTNPFLLPNLFQTTLYRRLSLEIYSFFGTCGPISLAPCGASFALSRAADPRNERSDPRKDRLAGSGKRVGRRSHDLEGVKAHSPGHARTESGQTPHTTQATHLDLCWCANVFVFSLCVCLVGCFVFFKTKEKK